MILCRLDMPVFHLLYIDLLHCTLSYFSTYNAPYLHSAGLILTFISEIDKKLDSVQCGILHLFPRCILATIFVSSLYRHSEENS